MRLRKVRSGGQTGADQAGLVVARRFGLETGGVMPKGFKTMTGPRPDLAKLYGLVEHVSDNYVPRTYENARDSDGTVRLAGNFSSPGEICTLKAIKEYKKPYFDVDLADPPRVSDFVDWLTNNQIETLNVAGNAEETYLGAYQSSVNYLAEALFFAGLEMIVTEEDILSMLGLKGNMILYTEDRQIIDRVKVRQIGRKRT